MKLFPEKCASTQFQWRRRGIHARHVSCAVMVPQKHTENQYQSDIKKQKKKNSGLRSQAPHQFTQNQRGKTLLCGSKRQQLFKSSGYYNLLFPQINYRLYSDDWVNWDNSFKLPLVSLLNTKPRISPGLNRSNVTITIFKQILFLISGTGKFPLIKSEERVNGIQLGINQFGKQELQSLLRPFS